jgi:hypothetical protein
MKRILTLVLIFIVYAASAQENVKASFRKYPIGTTGCNIYFPSEPGEWKIEKSEDGSDVYTNTVEADGLVYDAIVVQFVAPFLNSSREDLETLLISYLDYLYSTMEVAEKVGYGKGQLLQGNTDATGVIDYWKWADGSQGKIKGWITDSHLAVLLVSGTSDPSDKTSTDVFLNGFRFPEK